MRAVLRKVMDRAVDHVAIRTGWAGRHFEAQHGRIRVLTWDGARVLRDAGMETGVRRAQER